MKKYLLVTLVIAMALTCSLAMAEAVDPAPALAGIDLTPIFQALIALLASLITIKVIPWVQARTTAQQQDVLRAAVSVAVYAAEQIYGAGRGKEKLMYVKGKLAEKGFHIDPDEIEAAVRGMVTEGADYHPPADPAQIE